MPSIINYNVLISNLLANEDLLKIPFDVTYFIHDNQDHCLGEVSAHQFILGLVSPVFKASFYGSNFKKEQAMKISGTTPKAFQAMVDFLYLKTIDFNTMNIENLFHLIDLAKCYIIPELTDTLHEHMAKMQISKEHVLTVASIAEEFQHFDEAHQILLNNVTNTLGKSLRTKNDIFSFCKKAVQSDDEITGMKLLSLLEELSPSENQACQNCQKSPCKNNSNIESSAEIKVGTIVKPNYENSCWGGGRNWGTSKITSIDGVLVKVERGVLHKFGSSGYRLKFNGKPAFKFCCQN